LEGAGHRPAPSSFKTDEASPTEVALRKATDFAAAGDRVNALRWADRASRIAAIPTIALLKAQLRLGAGDFELAWRDAQAAASLDRLDVLRLSAAALLGLGRLREARHVVQLALQLYAISEADPFVDILRTIDSDDPRGWLAVAPDLTLWGSAPSPEVRLERGDWRAVVPTREDDQAKLRRFRLSGPGGAGRLSASADGALLPGSDRPWPPDFRLDARCRWEDSRLQGWIRLGWSPRFRPALRLSDGRRAVEIAPADECEPDADGRHPIDIPCRPPLKAGPWALTAKLPDGRWVETPTSPVFTRLPPPPRPVRRPGRRRPGKERRPAAVLVPVYRGREETLACLGALRATIPRDTPIVVVDDASPEPALSEALRDLAAEGAIQLRTNPHNLGFAASVNQAAAVHPQHDLVILNADAEVYEGWLRRLQDAVYADADIGTATPLTNGGAIASYPRGIGTELSSDRAARIDRLTAETNAGVGVDTPTGVGFCLFVRRECWDEVGALDAAVFGRGYGEENDFCLRASRLGWRHRIAADVYVRHLQGRSFGRDADALRERNTQLLTRRHRDYRSRVDAYMARDPLHPARRRLDELQLVEAFRPVTLMVTLALPGGVGRVVERRRADLRGAGGGVILLRPEPDGATLRLELDEGDDEDLFYRLDELDVLLSVIRALPIERVELHHILGLPPPLVEAVLQLGASRAIYVHDYTLVCPRVSFIDGRGDYCGEPSPDTCDRCVAANGADLRFEGSVAELRRRSARWLGMVDEVVVPSRDTEARMRRYFPAAAITRTPWEQSTYPATRRSDGAQAPIRIAVIGAIGEQKGLSRLLACAADAAARRLPLEFVVIGFTDDDPAWSALPNTFVTGRYQEGELRGLIERERPQAALFTSIGPETWCFALSHALDAALPILALDTGVFRERLDATDATHRLLPLESPPETINNALLDLVSRPPVSPPAPVPAAIATVEPSQPLPAAVSATTPADHLTVDHEPETRPMTDASLGLTANVQLVTLNKGLYSFRVQAAPPTRVGDSGDMMLPALKVGIAPGLPAENVEIMDGLRGGDGWLFESSDMLVVKVKVSGTAMLISSYTARDLPRLNIEVDRLDGRRTAPAPAPGPPPPAAAPAGPALPPAAPAPSLPAPLASGGSRYTPDGRRRLPLRVDAHVSMVGDVGYTDPDWAGELSRKLPLEAFSIIPLEGLGSDDIEYKAVTARGTETAWTRGGEVCGARRTATPLSGIAIRLRGPRAAAYDLSYRGVFRSGAEIGPCSAGMPLKAAALSDYLVGFQLLIAEARPAQLDEPTGGAPDLSAPTASTGDQQSDAAPQPPRTPQRAMGPRFSVFRAGEDA
jgi:GT2 family glycosyltransferase